ncbi:hypothetical protein PC129_g23664 [Phytophthora cactorum]|uniref:Integrase catalytic domain-containing protein n=1 Tax=Phytophthora cactorum TaxID=29920 RepID=A0A8T1EXC8_9STRA|nr:hypothetical protein Pcac1_g8934 [Phytophthora cactorum]KAG2800481.1 hypothetical protein PC112_g20461 [Phytophthora cactorum]KAG2800886.1 hypothetical protein PC111_g19779 [Phytophthora cactorum]KAG2899388.1 hypothetical protein PC117_g22239 [Phytophthora cactorum]KAG2957510.1 hypothetical protein PC118_g23983 [Phytophthora cactorum]
MARWLSFFAEYNFEVKYKPGRLNVVADALSRRPDYELAHVTTVTSSVFDLIRAAYAHDDMCVALLRALGSEEFKNSDKELSRRLRASLHRYTLDGGLLYYSTDSEDAARVVVPHDEDLKYRILYEVHDTPVGGHLGREKTYGSVSTMYWWPKLYKWAVTYVRTCETCQRTKSSPHAAAPLASLPVPTGCLQSISMDFVFGLPKDKAGNTGIVVFIDRLSKMAHLAAVPDTIYGEGTASLFLDRVFRQQGLPDAIFSDRDPRVTAKFWKSLFQVLGTRLDMSIADHPQTDGQTERVNRVVEDILRSVCAEAPGCWSEMLPLVEFALNNAVHASTGFTPFYVNGLATPRVPLTPPRRGSGLSGGGIADRLADISSVAVRKQVDDFVSLRLSVLRQVRDAMAESQDLQKEYADVQGRGTVERFEVGDLVLLNAKNLPTHAVSAVFKTKLRSIFIGPFKVVAKKSLAYTLNLPKKMRTHPVFYVGLLKPYQDPAQVSVEALAPGRQEVAEPQAAGRQRVAEPQDAEHTTEGAATDQADPAAEQPDAQGRRPGSEGHSVPQTSPPDGASLRDLLPSGRLKRSRHERRSSASEHADPTQSRRDDSQREGPGEPRPPPALLGEHGELHYHVERLVAQRRRQGRTQYLVKWRGYPHSQNPWEFEVPLRQDCPDIVDAYDLAHPLPKRHHGVRRCRQAPSASRS